MEEANQVEDEELHLAQLIKETLIKHISLAGLKMEYTLCF